MNYNLKIVRLLANHPHFHIIVIKADRKAGQSMSSVFPHLIKQDLPDMVAVKDTDFSNVDDVFCCLPHGTTQEIIKGFPKNLKIVDLSADFRLRNIDEYQEWYGQPHSALDLQFCFTAVMHQSAFGLEVLSGFKVLWIVYHVRIGTSSDKSIGVSRKKLFMSLICMPFVAVAVFIHITHIRRMSVCCQLPVLVVQSNLIGLGNIIINAKSGVSGAGRGANEANLYTEIAEEFFSDGITRHRIAMKWGMQANIYVEMAQGVTIDELRQELSTSYKIYNLMKGASGQAVRNLNLVMGFPENTWLPRAPVYP
ncbi:probable N-acetyl-gamma-glutamyl-phosphate reductase, chloroplastic [Papaver somniferum]|uniref:probable N-acetyl-gamma-glutamyl-phosphate reductase, chloroplastic n=1 Tax=Papaver somniferum TaxID=3469 RepID=UPI000E705896|nr:probable N-acetyl-gamma-glutamyl-phosphate reductase, chloroplastic [Papaver somniferum]